MTSSVSAYTFGFSNPVVTEQDAFDINLRNPTTAVVNASIIIHPDNSSWSEYAGYTPSHAVNLTAFEPEGNRALQLQFNQSRGRVVVDLGGARYDGYRPNIGFAFTRSAISGTKNNYTLTWRVYNGGVHPVPQNFTITLPAGFHILGHVGIANYSQELIIGRRSLCFNITTAPYHTVSI